MEQILDDVPEVFGHWNQHVTKVNQTFVSPNLRSRIIIAFNMTMHWKELLLKDIPLS